MVMIKEIESVVLDFLKTRDPQVLVIKGAWGTGKTFTWRKWLKKASDEGEIALSQYAYVSLFGCNSLSDLKAQIFEQAVPTSMVEREVSVKTIGSLAKEAIEKKEYKAALLPLKKLSKAIRSWGDLPIVGATIDMSRIGWFSIRERLICIDDLERVGNGLDVKDIYGLISELKERKQCKIVLILNDEYLHGTKKDEYEEHREKVVDVELHFNPDTSDLVKTVFPEDYPYFNEISQRIVTLNARNIRTIQKIKTYLDDLEPLLKQSEEVYFKNAINSIVLFTVLYFSKPQEFLSFDTVLGTDVNAVEQITYRFDEDNIDEAKGSERFVAGVLALNELYKWDGSDELDRTFGEYVRDGYINGNRLQDLIDRKVEQSRYLENKDKAVYNLAEVLFCPIMCELGIR